MTAGKILIFILFTSAITVIYGLHLDPLKPKNEADFPTEEECMRPPSRGGRHDCCKLPKERIWGNLKESIQKCLKKFKADAGAMANDEETSEGVTTAEETTYLTTTPSADTANGRHSRNSKKSISERITQLFGTVIKVIRNSFDALRQTVVIITDHHLHHRNDSCFMECVFEDQGFLMNNLVNKAALLERMEKTLETNELWHKVATKAVEVCSQSGLQTDNNSTCQSGSEQMFRCVSKFLFFNCPNWLSNAYCHSLWKFYQKCPNGPPPDMTHQDPTSAPEEKTPITTTEGDFEE